MPDSPDKISITICGDGGCGAFKPSLPLVQDLEMADGDQANPP